MHFLFEENVVEIYEEGMLIFVRRGEVDGWI